MPVEIERKFLVTNDSWQHSVSKTLSLKQGYLNTDPDRTVRVRVSDNEAFLTIKSRQIGLSRAEFEYPIPPEDAEALLKLCDKTLSKDRHHVIIGRHTWEIDVFHDSNEGLVLAEIELNECAHHLRAGHRLRLALSTSYWPIVWPTPEPAAVTLQLENCALVLPVRGATDETDPANPGPARDFPTLDARQLRAPRGQSERKTLEDGTLVLDTFDDYGKTRDPNHGLICGSHVAMHYSIHPDDPASASFASRWNFTFERDGWQVAIETESAMRCDTQNFYLTRKLRATEGALETEVLTREWSETIPRGLL